MTQANYVHVLFKMKLRNHYIHIHVLYCEECISITRITRVNNICFCYVATSNDMSTHANFQVDGYHGC